MTQERFLEMRYLGQSYELSVPVDAAAPDHFLPRFHQAHRERYGHSDPSRPVEVVNVRLKLVLPAGQDPFALRQAQGERGAGPLIARRRVWFARTGARRGDGRPSDAAVYGRSRLRPGDSLSGPAIVVQMDATTAVPPGWQATVDPYGNLLLEASPA